MFWAVRTGALMFSDLARDDVFRLETARLWLRWPRGPDAATIQRFCSLWEVARFTARIPHPYPPGSAERFIYAAREGNASGRDLTLVMTPWKGRRDVVGSISLETRGADRLTLGFALAPEAWGRGLATEAAEAMIDAGFALSARNRDPGERQGRERRLATGAGEMRLCVRRDRPAGRAGPRLHGGEPFLPPRPPGLGAGKRAPPRGVRRPGPRLVTGRRR